MHWSPKSGCCFCWFLFWDMDSHGSLTHLLNAINRLLSLTRFSAWVQILSCFGTCLPAELENEWQQQKKDILAITPDQSLKEFMIFTATRISLGNRKKIAAIEFRHPIVTSLVICFWNIRLIIFHRTEISIIGTISARLFHRCVIKFFAGNYSTKRNVHELTRQSIIRQRIVWCL